jgi:hypothetical protein
MASFPGRSCRSPGHETRADLRLAFFAGGAPRGIRIVWMIKCHPNEIQWQVKPLTAVTASTSPGSGGVHAPRCTVLAALCVPEDEASRRSAWCGRNGGLHRVAWRGGEVEFHPSHGDWIRVLRANGSSKPSMSCRPQRTQRTTTTTTSPPPMGQPVAVEDLWAAHLAVDPRGPSREAPTWVRRCQLVDCHLFCRPWVLSVVSPAIAGGHRVERTACRVEHCPNLGVTSRGCVPSGR